MAARDRFELKITCPKCGKTGQAKVSEDDHPYMRSPRFKVDDLPSDFEVVKQAEHRHETVVVHLPCGVQFTL